jgi:hypothetical protein
MLPNLKITKLDAAKRQLETVIRLYFSSGEPVSIHTLTAAAYNVIRDVGRHRGASPMIVKDQILDYVKPEFKKEAQHKFNEAENFFKHAERDYEDTLDFNPQQSEVLILDACSQYYKLTEEWPPLFQLYQGWYMANHLKHFNLPPELAQAFHAGAPAVLSLGRQGYLDTMLPRIMQMRT